MPRVWDQGGAARPHQDLWHHLGAAGDEDSPCSHRMNLPCPPRTAVPELHSHTPGWSWGPPHPRDTLGWANVGFGCCSFNGHLAPRQMY